MFSLLSFSFLIVCVYSHNNFKGQPTFSSGCQRCNQNEHLEVNSQSCQLTCDNRYVLSPASLCANFTGCVCNIGYVRLHANGPCVLEDECPPEQNYCGPYEEETDCEITCPPQTCESMYISYKCSDKRQCKTGCNCVEGHLRNAIGLCVPKRFCPKPFYFIRSIRGYYLPQRRYHEVKLFNREWALTRSTDNDALMSSTNPVSTHSSSNANRLNSTQGGSSSPSAMIPCKGPNEEWHKCPLCLFENCDDVDCPPIPCNKDKGSCNPRCICVKDFFRNASGICIPADECPYYDIEQR